ncbi:MAG: hypothetical protein KC475_03370 [Cyanobacteria bacterium HKST-UBA03]|nr:hypothetical protein [Cyanobacteria bacterium HKST-UBA03]
MKPSLLPSQQPPNTGTLVASLLGRLATPPVVAVQLVVVVVVVVVPLGGSGWY